MAIKVTTEKDGRIAVAFGKTVRRVSLGEAYSLGAKLNEAAWASMAIRLAKAKERALATGKVVFVARQRSRR